MNLQTAKNLETQVYADFGRAIFALLQEKWKQYDSGEDTIYLNSADLLAPCTTLNNKLQYVVRVVEELNFKKE